MKLPDDLNTLYDLLGKYIFSNTREGDRIFHLVSEKIDMIEQQTTRRIVRTAQAS